MTPAIQTLLILLLLLQVKHMFADFFLQTGRMMRDRAVYRHMGRVQHASIHAAGSAVVFWILGAPLVFWVLICVLEGVVHFHIDWAKGRYSDSVNHGPADPAFWRTFGIDQLAHQLTYVAMLWAAAVFALA